VKPHNYKAPREQSIGIPVDARPPGSERTEATRVITLPRNIDLPDWEIRIAEKPDTWEGLVYDKFGRLRR
jgi:hypothetical protein